MKLNRESRLILVELAIKKINGLQLKKLGEYGYLPNLPMIDFKDFINGNCSKETIDLLSNKVINEALILTLENQLKELKEDNKNEVK